MCFVIAILSSWLSIAMHHGECMVNSDVLEWSICDAIIHGCCFSSTAKKPHDHGTEIKEIWKEQEAAVLKR